MTTASTGERVEAWFRDSVDGAVPPLRYERITGGRSNLTFRVQDGDGGRWILRRPPLGTTLGSAHDMGREHRILTGLEGTAVPAPRPLALCDDESVTGAPFYVMELVDGLVLRDADDVRAAFGEADRRRVGEALVDTLADLHAVDPDTAGLGELGRRDGYADRQLKRWKRQWEDSKTRDLAASWRRPTELLSSRVPPQHDDRDRARRLPAGQRDRHPAGRDRRRRRLGAVHARRPARRPRAARRLLGRARRRRRPAHARADAGPRLPDTEELVERYAQRSGRDVTQLDFFVALAYWKLAAILEGVYARYSAGAYGETI